MFELNDQVAVVTGAARGIGRRVADRLVEAGAAVVLTDFTEWDEEIREIAKRTYGVRMDVTDSSEVDRIVAEVSLQFERIDILVNNAGIVRDGLLIRMKEEDWRSVLTTNLDGVYLVTKAVLAKMMRQKYGRIVNISSVVGQMGNPGQANYVASKAGVIGFTKAVAREVASRNITVNAVAPGYVQTTMTENLGKKVRQSMLERIPVSRIGTVEDIAAGVLFLASKEAGYITGHVLNINGGLYM